MKIINQKNIFCLPGVLFIQIILVVVLFSYEVFSQGYNIPWKFRPAGTGNKNTALHIKNKCLQENPSSIVQDDTHSSEASAIPFQRGLNLLEWFDVPKSGQIQIDRYSEEDFQILKAMGCEAVRVPIDLLSIAGPAPDYELDSLFFEFLDIAVDRAETAGLFIVLLDGSWDPVIGIDPSIEPALLATWTQMAHHLKNRSNLILYEVLNEPHGISDADWNAIQEHAIEAIRAEDGFHTIVVTPANWSGYFNLNALPDYSDNNLLYTFHFYAPLLFTQQGTTSGDPSPADLIGVPFPYDSLTMPPLPESLRGTWWEDMYNDYPEQGNEAWMRSQLDIADQFQSERNVRLWCGEFGAYPPPSSSEDRAAWAGIVRSYLEEKGIAWTFFTDGIFEKYTAGCFETDIDTMIASAIGLTAPDQKEPASEPETSGFTFYDDFMPHGLFKSGWFSSGEYNLYSKESPYEGESCLKITGFEQYGTFSFRFCPFRDLSFLVNHGSTLDFWIRCASPGTQIEIRFEDTKTSDPNDHPWSRSTMVSSSITSWDGNWHHVSIPLKNFMETGSWDNNQYYAPHGLFDWKATDRFTIAAQYHSLDGIEIFFDNIRISDPITNVSFVDASSGEYQLQQNYPNPFDLTTIIRYRLPHGADVELTVYNMQGQCMAVLVQEYQAGGEHEVRFVGGSLDAGVYFYRLKTADFEDMKKLVVLR
jgi:endoglucanase